MDVKVIVPKKNKLGTPVNSFRMLRDAGEILLDFMNYSETEKVAQVAARVRITPEFLQKIRDHIVRDIGLPADALSLIVATKSGSDVN